MGATLALLAALSLSGCLSNSGPGAPTASTSRSTAAVPGGLSGGVLPSGSAVFAITLVNAAPSVSASSSSTLDLIGQAGEIGQFCTTAADCQCRLRWTDPVTGGAQSNEVVVDYVESDLARCSYALVPTNVANFSVSLLVIDGGLSSNELTLNYPTAASTSDPTVADNYAKVVRYQCKDVPSAGACGQTSFGGGTGWYDGLQDPQCWLLSISYNLYSTNLGADYGGTAAGFECPSTITDEAMVKYVPERYWPDFSNAGISATAAGGMGPFKMDPLCGTQTAGQNCCYGVPGDAWSTAFDGRNTDGNCGSYNTTSSEYNSRSAVFGMSGDSGVAGTAVDGTDADEPYDMALYSVKPLTGHDNVIYPANLDQGTKTTIGVRNGSSCLTGSDSTVCTCVTGNEASCRKFRANRHDYYLANFYDNTFKYPFCAPHTVGGASGQSSIGKNLNCSVDITQSPPVKGADVLGFASLPNSAGQCPSATLPTGKKWGLLWHFRYNFDARKTINITNFGDVGNLFCTYRDKECTGTTALTGATASCNQLDGDCAGGTVANTLTGPQYCTNSIMNASSSGTWFMGVVQQPSQTDGYRFGNCLELGVPAADGEPGWCSKVDGSAPYFLGGSPAGNSLFSSSLSFYSDGTAGGRDTDPTGSTDGGCFDPMQLYFQNSSWTYNDGLLAFITGLFNTLTLTTVGQSRCNGRIETSAVAPNGFDNAYELSADWQGWPFIAGNYSDNPSGRSEELRGVGYGGNWCNPTLPGSRWSESVDASAFLLTNTIQHADADGIMDTLRKPGWNDGLDVWLVGSGSKKACIEADISATTSSTSQVTGFLYNPYARITGNTTTTTVLSTANEMNPFNVSDNMDRWLQLNGTARAQGYAGLVSNFPKTIKNWFDFLGIGCSGKCDNSSSANITPPYSDWIPGRSYQAGLGDTSHRPVPSNAFRSGAHSSTDSWGGYGIFQFNPTAIESNGTVDHIFVVTPTGITLSQMLGDESLRQQYTPVRYLRGTKLEYTLTTDSLDTDDPSARLPNFPMCVLQDDGTQ